MLHPLAFVRVLSCVAFVLPVGLNGQSQAQTCVNGVCFVDRAVTGEIPVGNIRGAISSIDYDNDGFPDLVIADNAGLPKRLYHNVPDPARPGNRKFTDVTTGSGIDDADGTSRSAGGVIVADYNNDGYSDIYFMGVLSSGGFSDGILYRNDFKGGGNGASPRFTNVTLAAGVRGAGNTAQSISWADFDNDGFVDLLIANQSPSAVAVRLMHNNGNGTFTNAANVLPVISVPSQCYSHMWMDYDNDGYLDCFLLFNSNPPVLLHNIPNPNGGRMFVDSAVAAGWTHLGVAPMGIAAGDFDNDGDLDLAISDAIVGTYYRNNLIGGGNGTLTEITPFGTFFGWGTTWIDVNNDGWLDNYQAGSHGNANIDRLTRNNGDGTWTNISAALNTTALASQHVIQVDFNNDGKQDIITGNPGSPGQFISVYENGSTVSGHWLKLRLRGNSNGGSGVNGDAIGARVRVIAGATTQIREIASGDSLTATQDVRPHFGLGSLTSVQRIEVVWPRAGTLSNRTDVFNGPFAADQILTIQPIVHHPGDVTLNGQVNVDDLLAVINSWGPCPAYPTLCPADIAPAGGNNTVNVDDLLAVINNWG